MSNVGRANLEQDIMAMVSESIEAGRVDIEEARAALIYLYSALTIEQIGG